MNRVTKTIFLLTASTLLIACSKAERLEELNTDTLPQLEYCELRNSPERYDGKIVKISAQIANFGHGYYFDDERCGSKVYENLLDDNRTGVTFFGPRAAELHDDLKRAGIVSCFRHWDTLGG